MKKTLIVLSSILLYAGVSASAQKVKEASVPATVKNAFAKNYPGLTATWEKEAGKYEAGFKKDGSTMSALFDAGGNMTESEKDIKISALPASVQGYIKANYQNKKIKEAAIITKADGTVTYEAEVNGRDLIFDDKGKFIKEMKD